MKKIYLMLAVLLFVGCDGSSISEARSNLIPMEKLSDGFGTAWRFYDPAYNKICYVYDRGISCLDAGSGGRQ